MTSIVRPTYQNGFYSPTRGGVPAYPQLWRGCVGAWCPSLGPNGSILRDQSIARNHGTLTNMDAATDWVQSGSGWALDFDGTNDHILLGACPSLGTGIGSQVTVSAWINTTDSGTGAACSAIFDWSKGASNGSSFLLSVGGRANTHSGSAVFEFFNVSLSPVWAYVKSTPLVNTGVWKHVVATHDYTTAVIYVDGIIGTPSNLNRDIDYVAGTSKAIGRYLSANDSHFAGLCDDVRVYRRALSSAEVSLLYRLGRGGAYALEYVPTGKAGAAAPVTRSDNLLLLGVS